ncbi:unnamed protein product, partial [Effrenium voratum]
MPRLPTTFSFPLVQHCGGPAESHKVLPLVDVLGKILAGQLTEKTFAAVAEAAALKDLPAVKRACVAFAAESKAVKKQAGQRALPASVLAMLGVSSEPELKRESMPVVEKFKADGRVIRIDAERHKDEVWREVQALFGPSVVFVLGGPGAGKGTQCTKIAETFGYLHLSAGDLLREERNRAGSEYGELINNYIKEGKLVPVEITIKLLRQAMMKYGWEGGRYLIDGFPRSFDNLEGWESVIGNTVRVKFVLFFDVSEETMQARLVERGKTSGRADDNL